MMSKNPLPYEVWVEESLRHVIRQALEYISRAGLPGEHHFFITFRTGDKDVNIPPHLRAEHPDEMTIVLQHQYSGLEVDEHSFSVTLSFGGKQESLFIPYSAIVSFADPSVSFGLQLKSAATTQDMTNEKTSGPEPEKLTAEIHDMDIKGAGGPLRDTLAEDNSEKDTGIKTGTGAKPKSDSKSGEVIALDTFRKK
jgi:hypothetical protein